jgi:putative flippase GtrA
VKIATQFAKYVTVALLSAASDWVVFATLFAAFGWTIMAQATSRIVGGLVSFGINKYWSFQSYQHKQTLHEAWRFAVLFIASYGLSLSLFSALTYFGTGPYWAKLITDTSCFLFNFFVMRLWVYRPQNSTPSAMQEEDCSLGSGHQKRLSPAGSVPTRRYARFARSHEPTCESTPPRSSASSSAGTVTRCSFSEILDRFD